MKLSVVNAIVNILAGMKISRIEDKGVKATLINDYLHLRRFVREAENDRHALVEKFQADWADELDPVEAFRREGKRVVGHDAYLEAERDANRTIDGIFSREVEVSVKPVPLDDFLASCGGEELTLEQLAILQETGVVG